MYLIYSLVIIVSDIFWDFIESERKRLTISDVLIKSLNWRRFIFSDS